MFSSCFTQQNSNAAMNNHPKKTIFYYEQVNLDPGNYAGNFRYAITENGDYFYDSNDSFSPKENGNWDNEFPSVPFKKIAKSNVLLLENLLKNLIAGNLESHYGNNNDESFLLEKYFLINENETFEITIFDEETPNEVQMFLKAIETLLFSDEE